MNSFESIAEMLYRRKKRATESSRPRKKEPILIVDDNIEVIDALRQILQKKYTVVACGSYEEVERCPTEEFKVVLLDVKMAPKDGFSVFSLLLRRNPHVRIIFNTAYPGESAVASKLRGLASDGCLTKGEYSQGELEAAIERAMRRGPSPSSLSSPSARE
jgi:CheY-like chemotaxis protein